MLNVEVDEHNEAKATITGLRCELKAANDSRHVRRQAHLSERQSDAARIRGFQEEVDKRTARIIELGSELDAAEDRIGHLETALADARRGVFARLFGYGAR